MLWFDRGERPTQQALRRIVGDVAVSLRDQLLGLGRRRPDKATLRQRISEALQDLPDRLRREPKDEDERGIGT